MRHVGATSNAPLDFEELEPDGQTTYHGVTARLPILASDRPDSGFTCMDCSRAVGKATRANLTSSWTLKRGFSDADAAVCPKT